MRCFLAVDAGGSKCEVALADETGRVLGFGRSDYRHALGLRFVGGLGRSEKAVNEAISEALQDSPKIDELHVTGRRTENSELFRDLAPVIVFHNLREYDAILAIATADSGVIVLSGTGAFAYGRTRDGKEQLLDALGPLYGDHGSGFQIGLAACRAVGQADWSPRFATSLQPVVTRACAEMAGFPPDFSMTQFLVESRDRSEIASLAKLANEEAEKGDRVAREILVNAADNMVETIRCVIEKLEIETEKLPLIGAGGVAIHSSLYWKRVKKRVIEYAPAFEPELACQPQVLGLILALASQIGINSPSFRNTLLGGSV